MPVKIIRPHRSLGHILKFAKVSEGGNSPVKPSINQGSGYAVGVGPLVGLLPREVDILLESHGFCISTLFSKLQEFILYLYHFILDILKNKA